MPMIVPCNAFICYVVQVLLSICHCIRCVMLSFAMCLQVLLEKFGPDTRFVPMEPGTFFW
jgi:hypothetical protein